MEYLKGKKVILFPFNHNVDLEYFIELYNKNKIYLPILNSCKDSNDILMTLGLLSSQKRILVFVATRKFGNEIKRLGIIILIRDDEHRVSLINLLDEYLINGLSKRFKNNDLTYSEDIINAISAFSFENNLINRIAISVLPSEKNKISLLKKSGFEKEGVLRNYIKHDNKFYDMVIMSKIREV